MENFWIQGGFEWKGGVRGTEPINRLFVVKPAHNRRCSSGWHFADTSYCAAETASLGTLVDCSPCALYFSIIYPSSTLCRWCHSLDVVVSTKVGTICREVADSCAIPERRLIPVLTDRHQVLIHHSWQLPCFASAKIQRYVLCAIHFTSCFTFYRVNIEVQIQVHTLYIVFNSASLRMPLVSLVSMYVIVYRWENDCTLVRVLLYNIVYRWEWRRSWMEMSHPSFHSIAHSWSIVIKLNF